MRVESAFMKLAAALAVAVLMVACNTPGSASRADDASPKPTSDALGLSARAPEPSQAPSAAPAGPRDPALAQRLVTAAAELLQAGNEDAARQELQQALAADPQNARAQSLMRQITADPVATLGRESFSHVVKPGESLSLLAGRYLNDIHAFYILARYNDIKVPRQLAAGQTLRIPGKAAPPEVARVAPPVRTELPRASAPAASAPPDAAPGDESFGRAQAAERRGDLVAALTEYQRAVVLGHADATAKAKQMRGQLVGRHTRRAREAFARQDLDGSIKEWDLVLFYEPDNGTAVAEKKRAIDLNEKAKKLPR